MGAETAALSRLCRRRRRPSAPALLTSTFPLSALHHTQWLPKGGLLGPVPAVGLHLFHRGRVLGVSCIFFFRLGRPAIACVRACALRTAGERACVLAHSDRAGPEWGADPFRTLAGKRRGRWRDGHAGDTRLFFRPPPRPSLSNLAWAPAPSARPPPPTHQPTALPSLPSLPSACTTTSSPPPG